MYSSFTFSSTRVWWRENDSRISLERSTQASSVNMAGTFPGFYVQKFGWLSFDKKKRICCHFLTFFYTQTTRRCIILFTVPVVVAKANFVQYCQVDVWMCVSVCGGWKGTARGAEGHLPVVFFFSFPCDFSGWSLGLHNRLTCLLIVSLYFLWNVFWSIFVSVIAKVLSHLTISFFFFFNL